MMHLGDYNTSETVRIPLNTFSSDDPAASVTVTDLAAGDVEIHKDGSTTQRASDNGVTVSINFDTITGNHLVSIDLSDNSDAGYYANGSRYAVRIEGATVDGGTINAWIATFSIGVMLRPATAGRTLVVSSDGVADANVVQSGGSSCPAGAIPNAVAGAANGLFIAGGNAATSITNSSGSALTLTSSGGNGNGLSAIGNGSGSGIAGTAGATGHGIFGTGGATSGSGIRGTAAGSNSNGIYGIGAVGGHGIVGLGNAAGVGILGTGGASSGPGIRGAAGGGNAAGVVGQGIGSGAGINGIGGATGQGVLGTGGATSGAGIRGTATAGNSHGIYGVGQGSGSGVSGIGGATGHGVLGVGGTNGDGIRGNLGGTGVDIRGNVTGDITGNVSGSIGSVTGGINTSGGVITTLDGLDTAQDSQHATTQSAIAAVETDTQDIQNRLPAALVSGKMDADTRAVNDSTAAATRLGLSAGVIIPGTVDTVVNGHTPTATEFQADDVTEATADHFNGRVVIFTSGALLGQATAITGYSNVGGIGQFTVVEMTEAPANNDTFVIV